jgi:hypothetical protein
MRIFSAAVRTQRPPLSDKDNHNCLSFPFTHNKLQEIKKHTLKRIKEFNIFP